MYSSTHFGDSDLGRSNSLSGDEHEEEDDEFLRRRSTAASVQNSTHLGVLEDPDPRPVSRLRREKLADDAADFSLTERCFLRT